MTTNRLDVFEFVPLKDFAQQRGVSQRTVRRWIDAQHVEAERAGPRGHWRVKVVRAHPARAGWLK